jgi:hypothetical protein
MASATEAAGVWAAAQPRVDHDPIAREAARQGEERLGTVHPNLIIGYEQRLADGLDPVDVMVDETAVLAFSPGDANAAAAARAIAADERRETLHDSAVPDVAATPSVEEHPLGVKVRATHVGVADSGRTTGTSRERTNSAPAASRSVSPRRRG